MNELVHFRDGIAVTTTLAIAEGTGLAHASIIKLVRTYAADLEAFGLLRFEIQPRPKGQHGGADKEYALLSEPQATLLMTYMRNNTVVREFKQRLVKAFFAMAAQLAGRQAQSSAAASASERTPPDFTVDAIVDLVDGSGAELAVRVPIGGMPGYVHVLFAWNGERAPVSYFMALEAFDALGVPYPLEALRARQDVGLRLDTRQTLAVAAQLRLAVLDQSVRENQPWFESLYDGMVLLQPAELQASIAAYPAAVDVVRGAASAASRFVTDGTQAARTAMQTIRGSRLRTRRSRKDRTAELAAAVRMWNASAARRRRMSLRGTDHA